MLSLGWQRHGADGARVGWTHCWYNGVWFFPEVTSPLWPPWEGSGLADVPESLAV